MISERPILLVEDNDDDVFLFRQAARRAGIDAPIYIAEHGGKAIEYLKGEGEFQDRHKFPMPRLVLLDVKMPYMTGIETLQSIRAEVNFGKLVVVMLTTSRDPADIDASYRFGANSYIVKPSSLDEFRDLLRSFGEYWLKWNVPLSAGSK